MKFTITHAYPKDTETVFKVLTDKSYLIKKLEATGAKNIEIHVCSEADGVFVISRKMDVPSNPPGFAKKIIKAMNTVTGTDTWQSCGGEKKTGVFELAVKGAPGSLSGQIILNPTKKGCDYIIEFDVRVGIPLIGNKIAKLVENDTRTNQALDYAFTKKYLEDL